MLVPEWPGDTDRLTHKQFEYAPELFKFRGLCIQRGWLPSREIGLENIMSQAGTILMDAFLDALKNNDQAGIKEVARIIQAIEIEFQTINKGEYDSQYNIIRNLGESIRPYLDDDMAKAA